MKLSLERKIFLGFGSALLVLLLVTAAAAWEITRFRDAYVWVKQSYLTFVRLDQVLTEILGMEASVRGFQLTGDDATLKPYLSGTARLDAGLRNLRELVAENPRQLPYLSQLEPVAARAQSNMAARIAQRRTHGLESATQTAGFVEGQQALAEFWQVVRDLAEEERRSLDARLKHAYNVGLFTIFSAIGATVLAFGLVAVAGVRVRRDLARRHEAEDALQESLSRIEDLYHHAPCGYHSLDARGIFLTINETELGWLGYSRAELVGQKSFAELMTPASALQFADRFAQFKTTGSVESIEYELRRKDGTTLPVLLNATAIYDAAGNYAASRATVFDVTLRKRAEEERDRFFTLSRDLLSISDMAGNFKRVNPAWEQALGFTCEEVMAMSQIELVHPGDRDRTAAALGRLVAGEAQVDLETRVRCKDGSFRWMHWWARAAAADQRIFASARDITERKEADERIQRLNTVLSEHARQLEAANRELESFSYSVSHDLRAPLRHVDGFANLLTKRAGDTLDAESRRYLATISRSAKQMGVLIDDLLAFSRIGRSPLRLEPVDHNHLVAEVIADGRYDIATRPIVWEIGPLPATPADAAMLRQVWSNLIGNAVKYSGKKPQSVIAITAHEDGVAGEYVFSVRDNGVGFDMAYADKLFGVFQRLHGPAEFEGTGIGLANVRRIVSRHGGRTWAEARENEGAQFFFSLPLTPSCPTASS